MNTEQHALAREGEPVTALARKPEQGKVGYALAWLLGVPLPILLVVYLISRC